VDIGRRTCDREVASSTPAVALTTGSLGQLSLPSLRSREIEYRLKAGVKAGRIHLYQVAGNTV